MASSRSVRAVPPFTRTEVKAAFEALPPLACRKLLQLRALIFRTAKQTPGVGTLEEALRWGEPSYLTSESRSGTTVRIHWKARQPEHGALYVHCQTGLVEQYRVRHGAALTFDGNRAVLFELRKSLPEDALRDCIALALTYHQR